MQAHKNQRLFERFPARFPVKFYHSRDDFGVNVFLRDVSAQGMRLTTKERFFVRDALSIAIELPDHPDPMILSGKVQWAKEKSSDFFDLGVEFHQIDLMKLQRLYKFYQIP